MNLYNRSADINSHSNNHHNLYRVNNRYFKVWKDHETSKTMVVSVYISEQDADYIHRTSAFNINKAEYILKTKGREAEAPRLLVNCNSLQNPSCVKDAIAAMYKFHGEFHTCCKML